MRPFVFLLPPVLLLACGGPASNGPTPAPIDSTATQQRASAKPDSLPDGHNVIRADDGRPLMEGEIVGGKRDGLWTSYTELGRTKSRNRYVLGVLEGPTVVFYDNGVVRYTGQHHHDKPVGEWRFYDEQGVLTKTTVYDSTGVVVQGR